MGVFVDLGLCEVVLGGHVELGERVSRQRSKEPGRHVCGGSGTIPSRCRSRLLSIKADEWFAQNPPQLRSV